VKILYGVQCTGNGHLSRSTEIVRGLRLKGHDVHVLLSGRDPALLSNVAELRPLTAFHGLYYLTSRGQIDYLATARSLDFARFTRDLRSVDAKGFDLAVTDFEPMTSRLARRHSIPSVAIGHQYAFLHDVPTAQGNPIGRAVLRHAAPADFVLALHWHHFEQPVLPPVVPRRLERGKVVARKFLVYLPFEHPREVELALRPVRGHNFFIYGLSDQRNDDGHLHWREFSRERFLDDLEDCEGVICNAGFELPSEALHLGKKLLVKPLHGQMEQESNVLALTRLGYGSATREITTDSILNWLRHPPPAVLLEYRNVADCIVNWLHAGCWDDITPLLHATWGEDAPRWSTRRDPPLRAA
jgi:uncharacterized protein (TIGR00661 family)